MKSKIYDDQNVNDCGYAPSESLHLDSIDRSNPFMINSWYRNIKKTNQRD